MQQPLPSLSNAFIVFSKEEIHQELSHINSQIEGLAFMVDCKRNFSKPNNFQRQGTVNTGKGNFNLGNSKKGGNYFCTNFKISGLSVERCFKIHGYPSNFKNSRDKKIVGTVNAFGSTTSSTNDSNENSNTIFAARYLQLMDLLSKQSNFNAQTS